MGEKILIVGDINEINSELLAKIKETDIIIMTEDEAKEKGIPSHKTEKLFDIENIPMPTLIEYDDHNESKNTRKLNYLKGKQQYRK